MFILVRTMHHYPTKNILENINPYVQIKCATAIYEFCFSLSLYAVCNFVYDTAILMLCLSFCRDRVGGSGVELREGREGAGAVLTRWTTPSLSTR